MRERRAHRLGIFDGSPVNWLSGDPIAVVIGLVYGYMPFFILPLYAGLDRIDQRLLEASRDLGRQPEPHVPARDVATRKPGMLAAAVITALPMFGDYYTADLLSGVADARA